jgi:hypothetical protein
MFKSVLFFLFFFPFFLYSQIFSPQVISTAGNQGSTPNYQISYTVGQLNTYSGGNNSIVLSQGFQQSFSPTLEQPIICKVTHDDKFHKNMIIWEKQTGFGTAYYNIYEESTTPGEYTKIGSNPFNDECVFIDNNSNPRKEAQKYKISAVDSFGNESSLSPYHKTIYLNVYKESDNKNHLIWNSYEGKITGTYYIYSGKNINKMELIDSVQSDITEYFDFISSPEIQFYFVSAKFSDVCYHGLSNRSSDDMHYYESISNIDHSLSHAEDYSSQTLNYLSVAPSVQTINNFADTTIFNVNTNLKIINAVSDQTWLTTKFDTISKRIVAYADPNTTVYQRSAIIKVSGLNVKDQYVTVSQNVAYTAINNKSSINDIEVYPNPYQGFTNITFTLDNQANLSINIYSITGKLIKNFYSGEALPGRYHYKFSAIEYGYETGLYVLNIQLNDKQIVRKLIELK